jgi:ribonuclease P protein component
VPISTLKKRAEFLRVRSGRRWSTLSFTLEARTRASDAEASGARVGFTVSKKVGNAVVRNRVRRRLRALVRALQPDTLRADCDYVLIARPAAADRSYQALESDLAVAITRVHQPRPPPRRNRAAG